MREYRSSDNIIDQRTKEVSSISLLSPKTLHDYLKSQSSLKESPLLFDIAFILITTLLITTLLIGILILKKELELKIKQRREKNQLKSKCRLHYEFQYRVQFGDYSKDQLSDTLFYYIVTISRVFKRMELSTTNNKALRLN